jgi:hypothetical protein
MPVDGSRLSILDFDYGPSRSPDSELTIEVGDKEPELLMEQIGDMDIEVAMERRRTVRDRQRGGMRVPLGRSVTTASATQGSRLRSVSQASSPLDVDAQIALANAIPRSPQVVQQPSPSLNLQRSATAAGFSTARYPPRPPLAQQQANSPPQQLDGWESPPPPYASPPSRPHEAVQLGSPLVQPRPGGGLPSPLVGIPENGHAPRVHGGFGHGHPMHHQGSFGPLAPPMPQSISPMPQATVISSQPANPYGVPVARTDQNLAPTRISPTNNATPANGSFAPTPSEGSSRPVSHEGRVSPYQQQTSASQRLHTPDRPPSVGVSQPSAASFDGPTHQKTPSSITLTGANLQARLNQPVPPTPTTLQRLSQQYENAAPAQQAAMASASHRNSYNVPAPSSDQINNLNRRFSQTTRKPTAIATTNGAAYSNLSRRDFSDPSRVPASPPAGAWGAAGAPSSPSFHQANNSPNGLVRPNSRGSGRSLPISASTPNLHATTPVWPARPGIGRMDTIDSTVSSFGPGEVGYISQAPAPHIPQLPMQNHAISHAQAQQAQFLPQPQQQPYPQMGASHQARIWAGDTPNISPVENGGRRNLTDPSLLENSKRKGRKKAKGDEIPRSQTPMPTSSKEGKKKGSRCIVM